jgi:hypothetical protein
MFFLQRSSFLFVAGLFLAAATAIGTDGAWRVLVQSGQAKLDLSGSTALTPLPPRPMTEEDRAAAERAWRYMEANTRPETGLVDSVAGFPSTTLWDQGSYLLALVAAHRIGVIEQDTFDQRITRLIDSFERLPLFDGKLPNKAYDTRSLAMVDYQNAENADGIGWSALDIARMLAAFRTLEKLNPEYGARIRGLLAGWDLAAMATEGELWGTAVENGEILYRQEGRLGYEQYGARASALWGLDVLPAASATRVLAWKEVHGVDVPTDIRNASHFRAISPILSEPFLLQAMELGLDSEGRILAERVYRAQEARWRDTGIATMVSEDHINQAPYFLYSSVFSDGEAWAVLTETGESHPELRTLSVKATFGWDALYDTEYTDLLRAQITDIGDPLQGWPAGIYEADGAVNDVYTLNTNSVVIEAIHYAAHGPLWNIR